MVTIDNTVFFPLKCTYLDAEDAKILRHVKTMPTFKGFPVPSSYRRKECIRKLTKYIVKYTALPSTEKRHSVISPITTELGLEG